jgi:hypothetical protein
LFYPKKYLWAEASGLTSTTGTCTGENPGDLPAPFFFSKTGATNANTTFKVGNLQITTSTAVIDLQWNSKTGLVTGLVGGVRKAVPYTGNAFGDIPVGGTSTLQLNGGTLDYDYWYY